MAVDPRRCSSRSRPAASDMSFDPKPLDAWFGSDANTIGRVKVKK